MEVSLWGGVPSILEFKILNADNVTIERLLCNGDFSSSKVQMTLICQCNPPCANDQECIANHCYSLCDPLGNALRVMIAN